MVIKSTAIASKDKELIENQNSLIETIAETLKYFEGDAYTPLIRSLVKKKVPNNTMAKTLVSMAEKDPEGVTDLIIDRSYYKELGYPMDRKQKLSKPKKRIVKKKSCGCK